MDQRLRPGWPPLLLRGPFRGGRCPDVSPPQPTATLRSLQRTEVDHFKLEARPSDFGIVIQAPHIGRAEYLTHLSTRALSSRAFSRRRSSSHRRRTSKQAHAEARPPLTIALLTNRLVHFSGPMGMGYSSCENPPPSAVLLRGTKWHGPSCGCSVGSRSRCLPRTPRAFFRLSIQALPDIIQTSPPNVKTAVSVDRETMFRFDCALATNTFLNSSNLYAELAGHRHLSRVDSSSERKTARRFI